MAHKNTDTQPSLPDPDDEQSQGAALKKKKLSFTLTIIICTRNRLDKLQQTLDTLKDQKWDHPWELLVIDNGSDD